MSGWLVVLARSLLMLFLTFLGVRLMGKRQPARMDAFNFTTYLVIAVVAALTTLKIITNLVFGVIALSVWVLTPIALDYLALKSKWVHDFLNGKETVLIKQGKIMDENLFRARLTGEGLLRKLRSKNVFNISEVEFAVLETTGELDVLLKAERKPVTPHDLEWPVAPRIEPQTVILDGNILDEPLARLGLNREWLRLELEKLGVSLTNVFLGQVDSDGALYVDLFDNAVILPEPNLKETLYANLEKCQADLTTFALATQNPEAQSMYAQNAAKLSNLLQKLTPYLLR
jgi:uncharacterized membrane protein YcaP (DUF421 family)